MLPASAWSQYKADGAGPPPGELKPAIAQMLQPHGFLITAKGAKYCELWFRSTLPQSAPGKAENVTLPQVPVGALLGVIRFNAAGSDRRGTPIAPGLYLLRYGRMPNNENHQGVAPHRDFLVLTPAAEDSDPQANPDLDALVALSEKVSHGRHPAVLSIWKSDSNAPGFGERNGSDWVLETEIGTTPVDVIVAGTADN